MVGNRAFGDRIEAFADPAMLRAAYACLLLSPQVPMLFMGEEFAASAPFMFFCDFGAELAAAVAQGRRREFKRFAAFADDAATLRIPDPNAESTFTACKLNWDERELPRHRDRLALIRRLLVLRHRHLDAHLAQFTGAGRHWVMQGLVRWQWRLPTGDAWVLQANFSPQAIDAEMPPQPLYAECVNAGRMGPGGVAAGWVSGSGTAA
jgi:maltooligosyltrehalose trehalohydrolase